MILKIFSIRDQKSEIFNSPFFKTAIGEAERDFQTAVNDPKTTLNKYPQDFDLYLLGEFNDNSGTFESLDTPQHLMKAIQCIASKPKVNTDDLIHRSE